jgi:hypothetical protein
MQEQRVAVVLSELGVIVEGAAQSRRGCGSCLQESDIYLADNEKYAKTTADRKIEN